jgi:hypothetical protein
VPTTLDGPFADNEWRRRLGKLRCSLVGVVLLHKELVRVARSWQHGEHPPPPDYYILDFAALAADPRYGPVLSGIGASSEWEGLIRFKDGRFDSTGAGTPALAAIKRVNLAIRRHLSWAVLDCNDVVALQDATFKRVFAGMGSLSPQDARVEDLMTELLAGLFSADYIKSQEILTASLLFELQMLIVDTASDREGALFAKVKKFGVFATKLKPLTVAWEKQRKMQRDAIQDMRDLS